MTFKPRRSWAGVLALSLFAGAASAMTVQEFLTTANAIPQNPTALLRSDTRRLMAADRRPACRTRSAFRPFNAVPQSRRNISVTQTVGEWMAQDYPCA